MYVASSFSRWFVSRIQPKTLHPRFLSFRACRLNGGRYRSTHTPFPGTFHRSSGEKSGGLREATCQRPDRLETRRRYLPSGVQRALSQQHDRQFKAVVLRAPFSFLCGSRFRFCLYWRVLAASSFFVLRPNAETGRLERNERHTSRGKSRTIALPKRDDGARDTRPEIVRLERRNATRHVHAASTDHWLRAESNCGRAETAFADRLASLLRKCPSTDGLLRTGSKFHDLRRWAATRPSPRRLPWRSGLIPLWALHVFRSPREEPERAERRAGPQGFFRTFSAPNFLSSSTFLSDTVLYFGIRYVLRNCRRLYKQWWNMIVKEYLFLSLTARVRSPSGFQFIYLSKLVRLLVC